MRSSTRTLRNLSVDAMVGWPLDSLHRLGHLVAPQLARRTDRPWLALVVVPILIILATVTLHLLLIVPLVALMWWWGSSETAWVWILGILESAWGVQWAFFGLLGLSSYPRHRTLIAVLWIAYAMLVAGVGAVNRWRYGGRFGM